MKSGTYIFIVLTIETFRMTLSLMKTIAVKIPEKLDLQLRSLAKRRKVSKSKIVREALRECLKKEIDHQEWSAYDVMKDGLGIVKSDCDDLASNSKHMDGFGG